MFITLDFESPHGERIGDRHLIVFEGTPDEINAQLKGFLSSPILVHRLIVLGEK